MFATECSRPAATNSMIGPTMARILAGSMLAVIAIHTARQTRALARMPEQKTAIGALSSLSPTTLRAASPTPPSSPPLAANSRATTTLPARLPSHTTVQAPTTRPGDSAPVTAGRTSIVLPVKSSAPAIITRMSPTENASPDRSRTGPVAGPSPRPDWATSEITEPKAMKAPARTASTAMRGHSCIALVASVSGAACAIASPTGSLPVSSMRSA